MRLTPPCSRTAAESMSDSSRRCGGDVDTLGSTLIPPVGPHVPIDVLLVGALMWGSCSVRDVLALVRDDDIENAALAAVLAAVRTLAGSGKTTAPQLVLDQLRRRGSVDQTVADALRSATTSGAAPEAARHYASAVVADSLRRRVESGGYALTAAAVESAETDLPRFAESVAQSIADCAARLQALRGEHL